jgi:Uma2 family endonuclease
MKTILSQTNLTESSRNDNPINGDILRYEYTDGTIIEKQLHIPTEEELQNNAANDARAWRNNELQATDFIVPLSDYPNRDAWLTYRQELRDWTTTSDFPETKPTKP